MFSIVDIAAKRAELSPDKVALEEIVGGAALTYRELDNRACRFAAALRDRGIAPGDRIAILGERSTIHQVDTPERILARPIDDFVNDFIGNGSTIKGLNFLKVDSVTFTGYPYISVEDSPETGRAKLAESGYDWLILVDEHRSPIRWLQASDLAAGPSAYATAGEAVGDEWLRSESSLFEALELMVQSASGLTVVVDAEGHFQGVVSMGDLNKAIRRAQREAQRHYEDLEANA
ncbi:AMP-binding protein [Nocardioides sp.]|uniref:AMP-binding protein n=1 Tax=Nocardioides sp. TaxID=35761 RepID=UPI002B276EEA|nr:AMP-binding protein [Nocardioides sp.]